MYIVRRWYAYQSPHAMYYDKAFESLDEAHRYADKMISDAETIGNKYRIEIISATARVTYKSDEED